MNAVQWQLRAHPDVNFRYLFYQEDLNWDLLNFNNSTTWPLQEQGRKDAQDMLKIGEGVAFKALGDYMDDLASM